jgi:hypothetical protein
MRQNNVHVFGQFLEVDDESPGGYTLHKGSGKFRREIICYNFGLLEFNTVAGGVLMLSKPLPASHLAIATKAMHAYIAK